jgi:AAA15 family ATPase/GTPase
LGKFLQESSHPGGLLNRHLPLKRNNLRCFAKTSPESSIFTKLREILSQGVEMLLRFSVENWMSFRDEATLDMVATREKRHANHLARLENQSIGVLPVAVIYGGNASGKSNFTKALHFAKNFVLNPPKAEASIGTKQFLLGEGTEERPTRFRFEILARETIYEYSFSLTTKRIVAEELVRVNPRSEERLFRRVADPGQFFLYDKVSDREAQNFAFRGTRENQLFLNNSVSQRLPEFKTVFDWFYEDLMVIDPNTYFAGLLDYAAQSHPRSRQMTKKLRELDSGIHLLRAVEVSPASVLPKEVIESLSAELIDGSSLPLGSIGGEEGVYLRLKEGKPTVSRLIPFHQNVLGKMVPFDFSDESDGTRRLCDVLPAFLMLGAKEYSTSFVIDELDRSLHPNLTRNLIEEFLTGRHQSSRSQLIFTTHDAQLMTQDIFRRDEIWVTERDRFGASKLVAFSEFKDVRSDKDIRKSYLQGRMGGVPRIRTTNTACEDEAAVR